MSDIGDEFDTDFGFDTTSMLSSFTADMNYEYSDEMKLAMKLLKSSQAISEFVDFLEEHDIDGDDIEQNNWMDDLSTNEAQVMYGFMALSNGLAKMNDHFEDDNDENPFRVK